MTSTSLWVSSNGATARLSELDIIANNLANADTTGFRADEPTFAIALEAALVGAAGRPVSRAAIHSFVETAAPTTRQVSGAAAHTGRDLDAAIDGTGFFRVQTPAGTRYTRAGSFQVDVTGALVTPAGHPVLGAGGPITLGRRSARIDTEGRLVDSQGQALGRLSIEVFEDPDVLVKEGASLFRAPELAERRPATDLKILPGMLETSNVQPASELARLVALQRAYDAAMQVLEADDAASRRLIQEVSS